MKIIYVANHNNPYSDDTEGHITLALKDLGHDVVRIMETNPNIYEGDLLLFHKWTNFERIKQYKCPRVMWYFDKVEWNGREPAVKQAVELCDKAFFTDGTWVEKQNNPKLVILRQAIGEILPTYEPDYKYDVSIPATLYGDRLKWFNELSNKVPKLTSFIGYYNAKFSKLVSESKIWIAPPFPGNDNYWSNRVYMVLGCGGFLLHPDYKGLEQEYTNKELATYLSTDDLLDKVKYYLENDNERERIRKAGLKKTRKEYNFTKRCQTLLEHLNIGTREQENGKEILKT